MYNYKNNSERNIFYCGLNLGRFIICCRGVKDTVWGPELVWSTVLDYMQYALDWPCVLYAMCRARTDMYHT